MLCYSENTANYEFLPFRRLGASSVQENHLGFLPFITQQQQQQGCMSFFFYRHLYVFFLIYFIFNQFQNTLSETH